VTSYIATKLYTKRDQEGKMDVGFVGPGTCPEKIKYKKMMTLKS
jgi:hypothetical protein